DDQLWEYLASLTVSVLPYRFGTHSGWLEACFDLGTAVVAPSCGYYHHQRPCACFEFDHERFDESSLAAAIRLTYDRWLAGDPAPRAQWAARLDERRAIAAAHRAIYRSVLA
ncbi:MAG: glycosyltransferase family 1 protein, partial [Mycobacteriaceae bacterium]|nr:glycosyltransferase family 1 protein [Mycobacteriaceae bacterium]